VGTLAGPDYHHHAADVKRNFFGKRAVLIYLLALMPIGLLSLMAILLPPSPGPIFLNIRCGSH